MTNSVDDYQALACTLYDHVELVCIHHYRVKIRLVPGSDTQAPVPEHVVGIARTTQSVKGKGEFLLLDTGDELRSIRLDHISSLEALDAPAGFDKVDFR